ASDADAALHAVGDFLDIILEAAQGADLALEDLFATAHDANLCIAAQDAFRYPGAGDGADLGNADDVDDLGTAKEVLLEGGIEEAEHGFANLILQLVDDRMQA